jgi:hypothetical protein
MMRLMLATLLISSAFAANAICVERHPLVEAYLRATPDWSIIEIDDLPGDDKILWQQYHDGEQPGLAVVNLDGKKRSYVLALHKKKGDSWLEQLVLLKEDDGTYLDRVIVKPKQIFSPFVVWRVGPGSYLDRETGENVRITNDSFVFEKMESTSTQFYMANGKLQSLVASE